MTAMECHGGRFMEYHEDRTRRTPSKQRRHQLREAALKQGQAVHNRRRQNGWLKIRRTERAEQVNEKSGPTAGKKERTTAGNSASDRADL